MVKFGFKFISGKYTGSEFPVPTEGELLIGRSSDLDMVLVEDMVSRKHAKVSSADGTLNITDLGSTNGTFVNGEKIRRTTLKKNDRILVGTSILKVIPGSELSIDPRMDLTAVREMMEDVANRSPANSTMSGDLEEVPLPDLLQLFATNKKSGVLTISGENRGKVYIRGGQIQYAVIGGEPYMKPMKAIGRMVGWPKGSFRLEAYEEEPSFPETFQESTESVLMEALRQLDELKRLMPEMPPSDSHLAMCVPMTPKLSELNEQELDILQLVVNFNAVKAVVDKTEGTDYQAVSSLHKLLRAGYIEVE